jgi:hypothetical protein
LPTPEDAQSPDVGWIESCSVKSRNFENLMMNHWLGFFEATGVLAKFYKSLVWAGPTSRSDRKGRLYSRLIQNAGFLLSFDQPLEYSSRKGAKAEKGTSDA